MLVLKNVLELEARDGLVFHTFNQLLQKFWIGDIPLDDLARRGSRDELEVLFGQLINALDHAQEPLPVQYVLEAKPLLHLVFLLKVSEVTCIVYAVLRKGRSIPLQSQAP